MKNTLTIIMLVIVWSSTVFTQNQSPNTYDMSTDTQITKQKESNDSVVNSILPERIITSSIIIVEVIILLLLLFYWKKARDDSKVGVNNNYKRNIKAIRDERVIPVINTKNSSKRRSLKNQLNTRSLNGKTITIIAKKLSIAKGEMFLAARIQQLQNQTR